MLNLNILKTFSFSSVTTTRQGPLSASLRYILLKVAQRGGFRASFVLLWSLSLKYHLWMTDVFFGICSNAV